MAHVGWLSELSGYPLPPRAARKKREEVFAREALVYLQTAVIEALGGVIAVRHRNAWRLRSWKTGRTTDHSGGIRNITCPVLGRTRLRRIGHRQSPEPVALLLHCD